MAHGDDGMKHTDEDDDDVDDLFGRGRESSVDRGPNRCGIDRTESSGSEYTEGRLVRLAVYTSELEKPR
ncbi:hypothetical protein AKJ16_DCAP19685 [Drosera capensis]